MNRELQIRCDEIHAQLDEARFRLWLATTCYEAAVLLMIQECGRIARLPTFK